MLIAKVLMLTLAISLSSCLFRTESELDRFYEKVEQAVHPKSILTEFKNDNLDSAVINYSKYPEIFTVAFQEVLQDSLQEHIFETYYEGRGIELNSRLGISVVIATFHKYVNRKNYEVDKMRIRMQELLDKFGSDLDFQ